MADVALRLGAVIDDRYVLKRVLGAGGCGAVWLAADRNAGDHEIVLKILHPHFDKYSIAVKQLAREAEVLSQLAHPNIAKPFAFSTAGQHSYLAMEYIDGKTLDTEIGIHTRLDQHFDQSELVRIFEELCSAVIYAHSKTIIHRDLKPQNVMIMRRGKELGVKVLDFGIAKLLEGSIFDATTFGRRLGSMFYMSPEQCKGEPADERSDVFSLGAILFEVLTLRRTWAWDQVGRPLRAFDSPVPADGANALSSVLLRVATASRPRPSEWRPKLSPKFDELVTRALSIDPARRFPGVEPMLVEFRRAAGVTSGAASASEGARPSKEFLTEVVTVRATAPSLAMKPIYNDVGETKLDRPAEEEVKQKGNVWKIGGIQHSDKVATAKMKDPIDDDVDETVPKLELSGPITGDSGVTIGVGNPDTALFEAFANRVPPNRKIEEELSITSRAEISDPAMTQAGELSEISQPISRTGTNPRVQHIRPGMPVIDPNATLLQPAAFDQTPLEGLVPDPNATPSAAGFVPDTLAPGGGHVPATELMYAVPDVDKLAVTGDVADDQTPVRAARFRVIAEKPGLGPTATDQDAAADDTESAIAAAFYRLGGAIMKHRLAILGLVGMLLAFVIGIVLARWAAQEVRPRPVVVPEKPIEKKSVAPSEKTSAALEKRYPHLDALLAGVKQNPKDANRFLELRDAILEASNDVASEKKKLALRRNASSSARLNDIDGLAACIEELRSNEE